MSKKIGAILGLIFLAIVSFGGLAQAADPIAPYVKEFVRSTTSSGYLISGTADPGTAIRIQGGNSTVMATTSFGGTWSALVDTDDNDDLRITSTNGMGERSVVTTYSVDNQINNFDDNSDNLDADNNDNNDNDSNLAIAYVIPGQVF